MSAPSLYRTASQAMPATLSRPLHVLRRVASELAEFLRFGARQPARQAAILIADIIGSSGLAETLPPHEVLRVLQQFHGRMAVQVRENGGTIVNYMGDGLVASFEGARGGLRGAGDALNCARDMLGAIGVWNSERAKEGKPAIPIGIGIHYGAVVMGIIGVPGHVQRGVFGDPVNVAKRLETMTRAIGSPLVVSDEVVEAMKSEPGRDARLLSGLRQEGPIEVRGRCSPVSIWVLDPPAARAR